MKKLKRIIITSLIALSAVCAGSALSACVSDGGHEHAFGEWQDLVNTCTDRVQVRKCAECGLEETQPLAAAGHTFGDWTDIVDICEKHVQSHECTKCGAEEVRELEADGHNYGDWVLTVDTCTERVRTRECEDCGHTEILSAFPKGHNYGDWVDFVNSCTDHVQIRICQNKDCGWKEYQSLKAAGHTYGTWQDIKNTCSEHIQVHICSLCGAEETQEIPAHGHSFIADRCVYCGTLGYNGESLDYLDRYNGTYGRDFFESNRLYAEYAFYKRIDEQARIFHVNTQLDAQYQSINGSPCYVVSRIEFADLGLSYQKAVSVWKTYKDDNPLYYWLSNGVSIESDERLILLCYSDYATGNARRSANQLIDSQIIKYLALPNTTDNIYGKALAFHDAIIKAIDYAYQSDGKTPSTEAWAHNIMGVFEERGGTCEAYTRAFQLLLNYAGIENVGVTGTANGGGHSWNLVKLDDGNWYWCDLTWDDTPSQQTGISHNYFMVNDTQNVNRQDGGTSSAEITFLDSHTYETPEGTGVNFLYALPERSSEIYSVENALTLRRTFNTSSAVYAVTGHNTVQLTNTLASGAFDIPETVVNFGVTYTVTSIGKISNGLFDTGSVLSSNVTSVTVPETVVYIWDGALYGANLQVVTVDEQNAKYSSVDGVLFYYSGKYLLQYPCDRAGTSYTIPDGCTDVAYGAFNGIKNLKSLTIGKDVSGFGLASWGTHYEHSRNSLAGELASICRDLKGGKISVHAENERFVTEENALYTVDPVYKLLRIECVFDKSITSFELGANVFRINFGVFTDCGNLAAITVADGNEYLKSIAGIVYDIEWKEILVIPNAISGDIVLSDDIDNIGTIGSGGQTAETFNRKGITSVTFGKNVTVLGSYAFAYCSKLTTINYGGTYEEWREIKKAETWCYNTGNIRIVCSGGIVCDKNGNIIATAA